MTKSTSLPKNEKLRMARLRHLMVLESPLEPIFDEICELARKVCGAPIALANSLNANHQWFKENLRIEKSITANQNGAVSAHSILQDKTLALTNAAQNGYFETDGINVADNTSIRFYTPTPLALADDAYLDTLSVVGRSPKKLNKKQLSSLESLANIVAETLVLREGLISEIQNKATQNTSASENSEDAIICSTLDGMVTSWSSGAKKLLGYTANEIICQRILKLLPEERLAEEGLFINKIKNNQSVKYYETERLSKSGKCIPVSISLSPIKSSIGEIIGVTETIRDISKQKALQDKISKQHDDLKANMYAISDAVIAIDNNRNILYLNPVAEHLTGWSNNEVFKSSLNVVFQIINEQTRKPCLNPVELCISEDRIIALTNPTLLINRYGIEYRIEDSAAPIRNQSGKTLGVILVFHDISKQRSIPHKISYHTAATHDSLTGLLNRKALESQLDNYVNNQREPNTSSALLFVDLDQFKKINAICGRSAGDVMLKEVGKIITSCIRNADILARVGGDEFSIILSKCNIEKAMKIAKLICKLINDYELHFNNERLHISASIGMVMIDHWTSLEDLMQAAETACLEAKKSNLNHIHLHFDDKQLLTAHKNTVQWASRITQALEDGSFVLFAQRIMPLNKQDLAHAEILIRLQSKDGELIPPEAFLPAAEHFNIISRIDRWVLKTSLEWIQLNANALLHIDTISINLSGQSLIDFSFHEFARNLIDHILIDYKKICFEINETAAISNLEDAKTFIDSMQLYGIQFSIDDCGSGPSSYAYLKNLPVNYLKIDGQFTRDLPENKIGQATIKCITEIAKITNAKTIAQWVDNQPVEDMLIEMGVDYFQGYYKHKPAPIEYMLDPNCFFETLTKH